MGYGSGVVGLSDRHHRRSDSCMIVEQLLVLLKHRRRCRIRIIGAMMLETKCYASDYHVEISEIIVQVIRSTCSTFNSSQHHAMRRQTYKLPQVPSSDSQAFVAK